jgi:hypothetical protein
MDISSAEKSPVPPRRRDYVAFDLEIARIIPDGVDDWDAYRPFGITCAATVGKDGVPRLWHGSTPEGGLADRMSAEEVCELVTFLADEVEAGKTILTWNGAGFDFSVLAEESGMHEACSRLASRHVDMMFHFFCLKGFAIGLDKAAKGMALKGKMPGIDGALAPRLWQEGQRQQVLDYVAQDVISTMGVCKAVERKKLLQWTTSKGTSQILPFSKGWLLVEEAASLPPPDTTWMRNPWPRSKFTRWMEAKKPEQEAAGDLPEPPAAPASPAPAA